MSQFQIPGTEYLTAFQAGAEIFQVSQLSQLHFILFLVQSTASNFISKLYSQGDWLLFSTWFLWMWKRVLEQLRPPYLVLKCKWPGDNSMMSPVFIWFIISEVPCTLQILPPVLLNSQFRRTSSVYPLYFVERLITAFVLCYTECFSCYLCVKNIVVVFYMQSRKSFPSIRYNRLWAVEPQTYDHRATEDILCMQLITWYQELSA